MIIRRILLPLSGTAEGEAGLRTALAIARIWNAHVTAVYIRVDPNTLAELAGEALPASTVIGMLQLAEQERAERVQALEAMFGRARAECGVTASTPAPDLPSASFLTVPGSAPDLAAHLGRLTDLVVAPHPRSTEDVSSSNALHALLFDSGRPVLVAPRQAPQEVGHRICVGWNGTSEAAASVWFALPWLKRANSVAILWSEDYQRRGPLAHDLAAYLADHGVHAEVIGFRPVRGEIGAGLLAAAREFGADLLTMGAYSHSRLRQLILGGVTRHVLETATIPVMMSR
jgi:nucleotide-binding universal stress UspA family protein